jgi:hypothetical protein
MKITRTQLKKLITESLTTEREVYTKATAKHIELAMDEVLAVKTLLIKLGYMDYNVLGPSDDPFDPTLESSINNVIIQLGRIDKFITAKTNHNIDMESSDDD